MESGEDKMAGQRRLNGNLWRLEVTCLAHHDAIGILAQERAQGSRERQADGFVHRYLHDSFQIVFDRFFRSEQLRIDRIYLPQAGIKRGRLSRAGWSGRNENAVGTIDDFEKIIADVIGHAERLDIKIHSRAIEHTKHEALTKLRW